jgi:hypothetical protein
MQQHQLHEPSKGAKYAIFYLTAGALLMIWSAVWFYYLKHHDYPAGDPRYYICTGLLLSGAAVFVIGALIGRIGKEAKQADVPVATVAAATVVPGAPQPNSPAPAATPPATSPAPPREPPVGAAR